MGLSYGNEFMVRIPSLSHKSDVNVHFTARSIIHIYQPIFFSYSNGSRKNPSLFLVHKLLYDQLQIPFKITKQVKFLANPFAYFGTSFKNFGSHK